MTTPSNTRLRGSLTGSVLAVVTISALLAPLTSRHPAVRPLFPDTGTAPATSIVRIDARYHTPTPQAHQFGTGIAWTSADNTANAPGDGTAYPQALDRMAQLNLRLLRFPSGLYSNCYDWSRGVGPRAARQPQLVFNFSGSAAGTCSSYTRNDFGTDEFMTEVARLSAAEHAPIEPVIEVNICSTTDKGRCGSGGYTPLCPDPTHANGCPGAQAAANWVEYLNGAATTPYGAMRLQNTGQTNPYGVKYFEIGNETTIGETVGAPYYSDILIAYARAMRAVDPTIKILAQGDCICTSSDFNMDRTQLILQRTGSLIDALAPHFYIDVGDTTGVLSRYLTAVQATIDAAGLGGRISVMPTEWSASDTLDSGVNELQKFQDMAATVNDATMLQAYVRHGVPGSMFYSLDGGPYQMMHCSATDLYDYSNDCLDPSNVAYFSSVGRMFQLFNANLDTQVVDTSALGSVHAQATMQASAMHIELVNPGPLGQRVALVVSGVNPSGEAQLTTLAGPPTATDIPASRASYAQDTTVVAPVVTDAGRAGHQMTIDLPGVSVAVLTVQLGPGAAGEGYWLTTADGGVFPFGSAGGYGSMGGARLAQPIVGSAATPGGGGYWLAGADGAVFRFGEAADWGGTGGVHLTQPIVGIAATADGGGYWLVGKDGGVFPCGDAQGFGSTGAVHLNPPIVGMAATPTGRGYWLVASDGGIFPFGDAAGFGSTGGTHLNQPVVGMAASPDGRGYWLVAADGGIFPFGSAQGLGSTGGTPLNSPVVGMASD